MKKLASKIKVKYNHYHHHHYHHYYYYYQLDMKLDTAELKKKTIETNRAARNIKASNKAIKAKQPTITKVTKAKITLANKATDKTPVEIVSSKGRKIK